MEKEIFGFDRCLVGSAILHHVMTNDDCEISWLPVYGRIEEEKGILKYKIDSLEMEFSLGKEHKEMYKKQKEGNFFNSACISNRGEEYSVHLVYGYDKKDMEDSLLNELIKLFIDAFEIQSKDEMQPYINSFLVDLTN